MLSKFIAWLLFKLNRGEQKMLIIKLLKAIVDSEDSSIDNKTAETIITLAVKSVGNKVTSFIIKD